MSLRARFQLQLDAFSLDAALDEPAAGVTAVFGASGGGKTTLLRCLAGLARARGRCEVAGEVWQDDARGIFLPTHERRLGMVFQDVRLFPHLCVAGNLRYAGKRGGGLDELEAVTALLGLAPLLGRDVDTLSGGERQRVAIARALLTRPRLLLLDEPLAALDAARKAEILPYLKQLPQARALPILYVSHSLDEVIQLADRMVLLDGGRTLAAGPTAELLADLSLPLAHRDDASVVMAGRVASWDADFHLAEVAVGTLRLRVARLEQPVGAAVRLRVRARDVSLALDAPQRTSILNVLPASVAAAGPADRGQRLLRLESGAGPLLARISERSYVDLGIREGLALYAQVKSVALA